MEEFLEPQYLAVRGKPFSAWGFGGYERRQSRERIGSEHIG